PVGFPACRAPVRRAAFDIDAPAGAGPGRKPPSLGRIFREHGSLFPGRRQGHVIPQNRISPQSLPALNRTPAKETPMPTPHRGTPSLFPLAAALAIALLIFACSTGEEGREPDFVPGGATIACYNWSAYAEDTSGYLILEIQG